MSAAKPIIGIIDTGIDFDHPEFARDGGHRILALWDQLDTTQNDYRFSDGAVLGSVYRGTEINRERCASRDFEGHGTMVASMAVGSTCGAAPDADLVVVKIDYFKFDEMTLALGIDFVRREAAFLNRPYIILLCYLPKGGAKDGETDLLARIIRSELEANLSGGLLKAVVAAAGNENYDSGNPCREENNRMHTHRVGNGSFRFEVETTEDVAGDDVAVIELWYPVQYEYQVRLTSPAGRIYGPVFPDSASLRALGRDGIILISNNRRGLDKWGAVRVVLRDPDSSAALAAGEWKVEMLGAAGVWHGYVTYVYPPEITKAIHFEDHTNEFKIRSAGNVRDVITVGSLDNGVVQWENLEGRTVNLENCHYEDDISHFSSRGPSKAGVGKPELYANGAWVRAALSQDVTEQNVSASYSRTIKFQPAYVMQEGTSFAAPQVAGAIARMIALDADGSLTHARIKYLLEHTAKRRGKADDSYQMLDLKKALQSSRSY